MPEDKKHDENARRRCARCGGTLVFFNAVVDLDTGHTFHLYRCKTCDDQQWTAVNKQKPEALRSYIR
jgi:hypothetical protein